MSAVMPDDDAFPSLQPEARRRVEALLAKRWSMPGDHPLAALQGANVGAYTLLLLLGPKSSVGSQSFQLHLADEQGYLANTNLALGLYNRGPYPAFNWIELTRYEAKLKMAGSEVDLAGEALDRPFFGLLSALVPPGGHLMIEYDSPSQRPTERILTLGYPESTSPTGYLLFQEGCRSFKNWHISEGWREGPRKLQGFKPWNEEIALEKTARLREDISTLLAAPTNPQHGEWDAIARRNASAVLEALAAES